MADLHTQLLFAIEKHCRDKEIPESVFGLRSCGDKGLVYRLRNGVSPTLRTVERIKKYIAEESK